MDRCIFHWLFGRDNHLQRGGQYVGFGDHHSFVFDLSIA